MDYAFWNVMRSFSSRSVRSRTGCCRIRKSCVSSYYGFQLFYLSLLLSCFGVWLASSSLVADASTLLSNRQSLDGSTSTKMTTMTTMMRRRMMFSTVYRQSSGSSTKRLFAFATPRSRHTSSSCGGYYYGCHDQRRGTGSRQLGTGGRSLLSMSTTQNNNDLVQEQLRIAREKKETKQRYLEMDRQRNLHLKRMLHSSTSSSSSSSTVNQTSMTSSALENEELSSSSTEKDSSFVVPPMYAIKVSVDAYLREEFHMSGREKRGRMFIPYNVDKSLNGLKREIHSFFRCLTKSSYQISAALPQVTYSDQHFDKTTGGPLPQVVAPPVIDNNTNNMTFAYDSDNDNQYWPIETDEDVQRTFENARQYFESQNETTQLILKRPTLILHVSRHPEYSPPPIPFYLKDMPDPHESSTMSMISFYSFPPQGIEDPATFAQTLNKLWKQPFGALGRVYVAREGINAQMSIPTNVLTNFEQCCHSIPELGDYIENGINIDPVSIPMTEFATAGVDGKNPPFKNLHIRVRNQIVADGLLDSDRTLNFQSAGYDMPPLEWHTKLKEARDERRRLQEDEVDSSKRTTNTNNNNIPVILDCRNQYETGVGQFEGAEPVNTENFRDTWDVLQTRLKDVPKDAPIMTYCTGGIRCVKVGAYLTQEMGFTNVSRLAGGIIAYDRTIQNLNNTGTTTLSESTTITTEESNVKEVTSETQPAGGVVEESMFKGTNYVFDGRVGRQITNDLMGTCLTCGNSTNLLTNCQNKNCHQRMVQCVTCKDTFLGACSYACKGRVEQAFVVGETAKEETFFTRMPSVTETGTSSVDDTENPSTKEITTLDDYCEVYSSASSSSLLDAVEENTKRLIPTGSHMVSGKLQGQLLKNLASMTTNGRILEIGTFTGYATLCFMEGSYQAAKAAAATNQGSSSRRKPFVMSLERDPRALQVAAAHLTIASEEGVGTNAAKVANELSNDQLPSFDEDVLEVTYKDTVQCQLHKVTDALATLEELDKHLFSMTAKKDDAFPLGPQQLLLDGPFDMVFVDADKTRLPEYADLLLRSDHLLKPGGFIVVDNVLWKGRVLDHAATTKQIQEDNNEDNQSGSSTTSDVDETSDDGTSKSAYALKKKAKRARRLALLMHKFNQYISNDSRAEVMIVPIRDGLSIIRKKIV